MKRINRTATRVIQAAKMLAHPILLKDTLIRDYALSFADRPIGDVEDIPEIIKMYLDKWQESGKEGDPLIDGLPEWLELNQDAVVIR